MAHGFDLKKITLQHAAESDLIGLEGNKEEVLADDITKVVERSLSNKKPIYLDPSSRLGRSVINDRRAGKQALFVLFKVSNGSAHSHQAVGLERPLLPFGRQKLPVCSRPQSCLSAMRP